MITNIMSNRMHVQSTGSAHKKEALQPVENFPLEIVNLLNVFARIEARRQARLRDEQKEVG